MTNYYNDEMDSDGNYHYEYFDSYFEEPNRKALFIYDDETLIGFAMLNKYSYINKQPNAVLAEFTIFPMYRKKHLGYQAAKLLLNTYKGTWELKYNERNPGAKTLWSKVTKPFHPVAHRYSNDEIVLSFQTY